jgi:DNA-directed RNA polymerase beta subunit
VERVYNKYVPTYHREPDASPEEKATKILSLLSGSKIQSQVAETTLPGIMAHIDPEDRERFEDNEDYIPVGTPGVIEATRKLLNINRGGEPADERDSLEFKKLFRTEAMLGERVREDAGKLARRLRYMVANRKNLSPMSSFFFDPYMEGHFISSQLASPLEEINPMHNLEQARRVTLMGPKGIQSDQGITPDMQALHPSVFGFLSALEGPESGKIGVDTRIATGAKIGTDGRIYQRFRNPATGKYHWLTPQDLKGKTIKLKD